MIGFTVSILFFQCLPFMVKRKTGRQPYIECPIGKEEHLKSVDEIPKSLITIQLIDAIALRRPSMSTEASSSLSQPALPVNGHPQFSPATSILTPTPAVPASAPLPSPTSPPYYLNQPIPLSTMPNTNPFLSDANNNDDPFDLENLNRMQNGYKNNSNQPPAASYANPYPPRPNPPAPSTQTSNTNTFSYEAPPSYDASVNRHRSPSINSNQQSPTQNTTNHQPSSNNQK